MAGLCGLLGAGAAGGVVAVLVLSPALLLSLKWDWSSLNPTLCWNPPSSSSATSTLPPHTQPPIGSADQGTLRSPVPGSLLRDETDAFLFRVKWACISRFNGFWFQDNTPRPLPWAQGHTARLPCRATMNPAGPRMNAAVLAKTISNRTWAVAPNLKYVWGVKPANACAPHQPLSPFNGSSLCASLRAACRRGSTDSIFIVGDSLMVQFMESLFAQLRTAGETVIAKGSLHACKEHARKLPVEEAAHVCHSHLVCGKSEGEGGVMVHFAYSSFLQNCAPKGADPDRLWGSTEYAFGESANPAVVANKTKGKASTGQDVVADEAKGVWSDSREYMWMDDAVKLKPGIVIVNRGAQFAPNRAFTPQLQFCLSQIRMNLPNTLLVYRSTAAAHAGCGGRLQRGPLLDYPLRMPPSGNATANSPEIKGWDRFEEQNAIAKRLTELAGGVYLDVYHMSFLRPDWHLVPPKKTKAGTDCLHFCAPGPVDAWGQLLTSMLIDLI